MRSTAHHPVFEDFNRSEPWSDTRAHYNFMGARISHDFEIDLATASPTLERQVTHGLMASGRSHVYDSDARYPHRDSEDYFEWIDLLTAIQRARGSFTMIEAGAGYGRWITNAAAAIRRLKTPRALSLYLIALEANQRRFEFMVRNCAENKLSADEIELRRQACTAEGGPVLIKCDDDYGANVIKNDDLMNACEGQGADTVIVRDGNGQRHRLEKVPGVKLQDLLIRQIDFLDMDIQGAELEVLPPVMSVISERVKLAHIATHATLIDAKVAYLFNLFGWRPRYIFPCAQVNLTQFGHFRFLDGIQSWENPRFSHS